jgi:peptide/nickel transport system substrate-binding protein
MRFAIALVLVLVVGACSSTANPPGASQGPAVLRIGIADYPSSFNPNFLRSAPAYSMYNMVWDTLTQADSTKGGALSGRLATEWALVSDTTWELKLRTDVKWHDGTPFTADDVAATLTLLKDGKPAANYASRMAGVDRIEAVNVSTVRITTKAKNGLIPANLADVYMFQAAQIKAGGNDAVAKDAIGTGPFKLKAKQDGVAVTLERNKEYWGKALGLDQLVFKSFPEDATRVAALESGEVDLVFNVPADDAKRLQAKGIDIKSTPTGYAMVVDMKTINAASPLAKKEVRQALNYAMDKDALINGVMLGFGEKLKGQVVGADGFGHNDKLSAYPYDPAKAKKMLADAGYPNGFSITLYTSQGRYAKQKEMSEAIVGQLKAAGIDVKMQLLEWGAFISGLPGWDMYFIGWSYVPSMDSDFVAQQFSCSSGFWKVMCNPAFDQLLLQERAEADSTKRKAILQQMQQILYDEAPAIYLYQAPDIFGVAKRVKGFIPTPDGIVHMESITIGANLLAGGGRPDCMPARPPL